MSAWEADMLCAGKRGQDFHGRAKRPVRGEGREGLFESRGSSGVGFSWARETALRVARAGKGRGDAGMKEGGRDERVGKARTAPAPEATGAVEQSLATAYFPTRRYAVSSAMESLTTEFGMGSGVPSPPWSPKKFRCVFCG